MTAIVKYFGPVVALVAAMAFRIDVPLGARATPIQTPPQGGGQPPPGAARGGGRGAGAMLFATQCAGCHGTDLKGGRARSPFDDTWLGRTDDQKILASILDGARSLD